jgi:hypothetical protein
MIPELLKIVAMQGDKPFTTRHEHGECSSQQNVPLSGTQYQKVLLRQSST